MSLFFSEVGAHLPIRACIQVRGASWTRPFHKNILYYAKLLAHLDLYCLLQLAKALQGLRHRSFPGLENKLCNQTVQNRNQTIEIL